MSLEKITQLVTQARHAHQQMHFPLAVSLQEEAVGLMREQAAVGEQMLGIQLYNLAGYYQDCGRYETAVTVLEEVVMISERLGHPDLDQDRATLEQARMLVALPLEQRQQLEKESLKYLSLTPEEREAERLVTVEQGLHTIAVQIRDLALGAKDGQIQGAEIADRIEMVIARIAYDESLGGRRSELVIFMRAVIEWLRGKDVRPVPAAYRPYVEALKDRGGSAKRDRGETNG